ncbi:MAG: response regulator transcription factor [Christensenellaceae bacterium]|nr:response regulator transcription factor [Christensenellaceae bacterium]
MSKILIVEDEVKIARFVTLELEHEGYEVKAAHDGRTGLGLCESWQPDLMILDLMLPELSGIEVCRRLRQTSDVPIIMLTAKDDVSDKVMGLDMGADDYMTKPFAIEELLARIRVNLKKHRADRTAGTGARMAGKLRIEPASYGASFDGEPIMLTKKEFDLLNYLWQHEGTAVTRDELLSNVWGYEFAGDTNIVDVYIRYLRQKIDDKFGVKTIHTIRAVGYMFRYE